MTVKEMFPSPYGDKLQLPSFPSGTPDYCFRPLTGINCNKAVDILKQRSEVSVPLRG